MFISPAIVFTVFQFLYTILLFEGLVLKLQRGTVEYRTQYTGFIPPDNWTIDRITSIPSSEEFFDRFMLPRKPVVISPPKGIDETFGWNTKQWQDVQYLSEKAGDLRIAVEFKNQSKLDYQDQQAFGRVGHRTIYFKTYLDKIFSNAEHHSHLRCPKNDDNQPPKNNYYLNLQDGERKMISPPLTRFTNDFSVPTFFFGQELHQINLWMGNSIERNILNQNQNQSINSANDSQCQPVRPTASVLHSDSGDNLYVILEGSKHIKLYNPTDVFNIYTDGCVQRLYPNGELQWCEPHYIGFYLGIADMLRDYATLIGLSKILSLFYSMLGPGELQQFFKEVIMPPPRHPHFSSVPVNCSKEDIDRKFPLFKNARPFAYTANAGDMVFIPTGWHHQVTSYGTRHVALNFWTKPPRNESEEEDKDDLLTF